MDQEPKALQPQALQRATQDSSREWGGGESHATSHLAGLGEKYLKAKAKANPGVKEEEESESDEDTSPACTPVSHKKRRKEKTRKK